MFQLQRTETEGRVFSSGPQVGNWSIDQEGRPGNAVSGVLCNRVP